MNSKFGSLPRQQQQQQQQQKLYQQQQQQQLQQQQQFQQQRFQQQGGRLPGQNQYASQDEYEYDDEEDEYDGYDQHGMEGDEYMQEGDIDEQGELDEDQIMLIDEDPNYDPSDEEVRQYGEFLGMVFPEDEEFLEIAREGLVALLPEGWRLAQVAGEDTPFFYEEESGQLFQDSPNDAYYQSKFQDAKRLREIKRQREQAPQQVSKRRSKLHNLIDQFAENPEADGGVSASTNKQQPINEQKGITTAANATPPLQSTQQTKKQGGKMQPLKDKPSISVIPEQLEVQSKAPSSQKKMSSQSFVLESKESVTGNAAVLTPLNSSKAQSSQNLSIQKSQKVPADYDENEDDKSEDIQAVYSQQKSTGSRAIEVQQEMDYGDDDEEEEEQEDNQGMLDGDSAYRPRFTAAESVITKAGERANVDSLDGIQNNASTKFQLVQSGIESSSQKIPNEAASINLTKELQDTDEQANSFYRYTEDDPKNPEEDINDDDEEEEQIMLPRNKSQSDKTQSQNQSQARLQNGVSTAKVEKFNTDDQQFLEQEDSAPEQIESLQAYRYQGEEVEVEDSGQNTMTADDGNASEQGGLTESEEVELQEYIEEAERLLVVEREKNEREVRARETTLNEQLKRRKVQILDEIALADSNRDEYYLQRRRDFAKELFAQSDRENFAQREQIEEKARQEVISKEVARVDAQVAKVASYFAEKLSAKEASHAKIRDKLQSDIRIEYSDKVKQRRRLAERRSLDIEKVQRESEQAQQDLIQEIVSKHNAEVNKFEEDLTAKYHRIEHDLKEEVLHDKEQKAKRKLELNEIYQGKIKLERKNFVENVIPLRLAEFEREIQNEIDHMATSNYELERRKILAIREAMLAKEHDLIDEQNSSRIVGFEKEMKESLKITSQETEIFEKKRVQGLKQQLMEGANEDLRKSYREQGDSNRNVEVQKTHLKYRVDVKKQELNKLRVALEYQKESTQFSNEILKALLERRLASFLEFNLQKKLALVQSLKRKSLRKVTNERQNSDLNPISAKLAASGLGMSSATDSQKIERLRGILFESDFKGTLHLQKQRSKYWNELLKLEAAILVEQKSELKQAKIFLKALNMEFDAKRQQSPPPAKGGKHHRDSKEWIRDFNSDVSNLRENESALRKRDLCLLEAQKAFNNVMDLGLIEDSLLEAYMGLIQVSRLPLLNLILVPANLQQRNSKGKSDSILNNWNAENELSHWVGDIQPIDVGGEQPRFTDLREEVSFEVDEDEKEEDQQVQANNKNRFKSKVNDVLTDEVKKEIGGVLEQGEVGEGESPNVRIEEILSRAKYSNKINAAKYSGYLYSREVTNSNHSIFKIRQEVANQRQWCNDIKGYMTSSMLNRSSKFANSSHISARI